MPTRTRSARRDYLPHVRSRSMRGDAGQLKLSPNYPDPGETKHKIFEPGTNTGVLNIVTPSTRKKIRLIRLWVVQHTSDGEHFLDVFFGTTGITAGADTPIDCLDISDLGTDTSRTWPRGLGPLGSKDQKLSIQWRGTAPAANSHFVFVEYTEER